MRKLLVLVGVLLYAFLLLRVAHADGKDSTRVGKASTRVTLNEWKTPILGNAPFRARIVARIDKPTPEWFCPSMEVTWTGGTKALRESDCEPLEDQEQPPKMWVSEEVVGYLGPGEHDILVRLKQGREEVETHLYATVF